MSTILYKIGDPIGYNKIYFLSGLNKDNIQNYDYRMLLIPDKNDDSKDQILTSANPTAEIIREKPGQIRYHIFFYTGDLDLQTVPFNASSPNTLGYGEIYSTNTGVNLRLLNSGFNLACTGTYPQFFTKDFYVYNTGIKTQRFYIGTSNKNIIDISTTSATQKNNYTWGNEDGSIASGSGITLYSLGRNNAIYFKSKIYSSTITGDINNNNKIQNELIYLHRVTGEIVHQGFSGFKSQKFNIPVKINLNYNNAEIFSDNYFYESLIANQYIKSYKLNEPIRFTNSGIINKKNKFFGLTLYATGGILENSNVKTDLNKKIYKLDEYSSTGIFRDIKTIYPAKIAETYYLVNSTTPWITNLNSSTQIFRWISGYTGLFDSNNFNPISGAIQQDVRVSISTADLLPVESNISGSNFTVKIESGNVTFNGLTGNLNLKINKKYRFLQVNNTNTSPFEINALQTRTFEPEYNKQVLNNYRLIDFNPNINTDTRISWTAGTGYSGYFNIFNETNQDIVRDRFTGSFTGESTGIYNVYHYNYEISRYGLDNKNIVVGLPRYSADSRNRYSLMKDLRLRKNQNYAFMRFMRGTTQNNYLADFSLTFWTGSSVFNNANIYRFNNFAKLTGIAPNSNVKYDIIKFSVPTDLSENTDLYLGITGGRITGTADIPYGFPVKILPADNFVETTGNYTQTTKPIFSGNLNIYTSNVNENLSIPFILSGISGFDNIKF